MLKHTLAAGAAIGAALAMSASAHAGPVYFSGGTTTYSGVSPSVSFAAPGGTVSVEVDDCCIGGDYYATYVDGTYIGTTPAEPEYGSVLSSGTFLTTLHYSGIHSFYVVDQDDFYQPAGLYVTITGVPEPGEWALMMLGVLGLGMALRTRRSAALNVA